MLFRAIFSRSAFVGRPAQSVLKEALSTPASRSAMATSSHYEAHSAESYERAFFYEPGAYMQRLVDLTSGRLGLDENHAGAPCHLLDIGGGTGNFAQALIRRHPSSLRVTVVDPFLDPTASTGGAEKSSLDFVNAPAEAFMKDEPGDGDSSIDDQWRRGGYQKILLKEVVHHFRPEDRVGIFRGMHEGLTPASTDANSILIITRPQTDIDYPLWKEAREVWRANQPSAGEFCRELTEAGFVDVRYTTEAYPCRIAWTRWKSMVQERFWSTFSQFSDDELRSACELMDGEYEERIDEGGEVHFEDRLVFVSAKKEMKD